MESIKLNETPVRTARNFNINNINIKDINIPNIIGNFKNIKLTGIAKTDKNVSNFNLKYGIGNKLIEQIKNNSNNNLRIFIENKSNIQIEYNFDNENTILVDCIEIIAKENSTSNITIKYNSEENVETYHNGIIKLYAEKNSSVNINIVNFLNTKSNNFVTIDNELLENAKINYCIVDFGGKNSITNYYSNLNGKCSENTINTIYLGKENQLFDLNYIAELKSEECNIQIEVQGALADYSKKHFKGTIDFKKGSKKSVGNENEFCILLSDKAKSLALPILLCSEEDVEGNHSSAAGKIDDKQLFYIMSRGFNYKEAMKLMVRAKFNKILENIKNEDLKNQIINEIDKKLD